MIAWWRLSLDLKRRDRSMKCVSATAEWVTILLTLSTDMSLSR